MRDESTHVQKNTEMWDKWADSLDSKGWRYEFLRNSQAGLVQSLGLKEGVRLLDVGCGTGWALRRAAEAVNNNGLFYGVDLSPKMIERARENFRGRENFEFAVANAESIPLEENSFDIIICTNSFHHYYHPDKALREFHRILKPSGKVYVLDPTADSFVVRIFDKVMKFMEPEHVKLYSTKEFRRLFEGAGFKNTTASTISGPEKVHAGEK
ncbi:MAG TPA: class I SAM-dependent methyltransferase [Bacteroidota bacterium]|nr:class I SAM-dependent methyltransferase [Bacteroidota bacterium]